MGRVHAGALTRFTYLGKGNGSSQLVYYGKKYFQFKSKIILKIFQLISSI
jgi:hypothetical protein